MLPTVTQSAFLKKDKRQRYIKRTGGPLFIEIPGAMYDCIFGTVIRAKCRYHIRGLSKFSLKFPKEIPVVY
jgi:hypothetical protein